MPFILLLINNPDITVGRHEWWTTLKTPGKIRTESFSIHFGLGAKLN